MLPFSKNKRFLLIFSIVFISLIAYGLDQRKTSEALFVDVYGTFQEIDFPKDMITFYSEDTTYEYTFQNKYYSELGTYELEGDVVYFRTGPLIDQQATLEDSCLRFNNRSKVREFKKISQTPVRIDYSTQW